jgi:hypothetical protein
MRRLLSGLALGLALALAIGAVLAAPQIPASSFAVRASAVSYSLNYSDPASDVFKLWTSNNSHVTDASGFWVLSPAPSDVNLVRVASYDDGANIGLYLRVQTTIASQANVSYEMRMYSRADNRTHYILDFSNGAARLTSNKTGASTVNMTANVTIGPTSTLNALVNKTLLGGTANITAWNIDGTARQVAGNYTYEDFGWSQPGNPGSAPAFIQGRVTDAANGAGLSSVNVSTGTGGYFTTTNATGYYSLPAAPGTFTVTFALAGYDSQSQSVTVQYQQTQTVNAALSKTSALASSLLWIIVIVIVVAAVVVGYVILRRRKKPAAPK